MIYIMFFASVCYAQNDSAQINSSKKTGDDAVGFTPSNAQADIKSDSSENSFGILGYPFAFYSPETQLAFGAGGMLYYRMGKSKDINLSKVTLSAYYTTNSQYQFSGSTIIYFPGIKQAYLQGGAYFSKEIGRFYGTGNETLDIDSSEYLTAIFGLNAEIARFGIFKLVRTGLLYDFSKNDIDEKRGNPYLTPDTITGSQGGTISGFGLSVSADTRDNLSYATKGFYLKVSGVLYRQPFASKFTFDKYKIDFRKYFMPWNSHIFAFQLYSELTNGNPPFYSLPAMGGSYRMRGYFEGRYRDKQYVTAQAEYRKHIWWRLGIAAFYGVGQVSRAVNTFAINQFKESYGFGLRFVFDEKEKINLRVDIGIAEGNTGVYFNLEEAF